MTKATPRPWEVWKGHASIHAGVSTNEDYCISAKRRIAECEDIDDESDDDKAEAADNAAFIVKAVNCHDDLLAACKAIVAFDKNGRFGKFDFPVVIRQAEAAIALAAAPAGQEEMK